MSGRGKSKKRTELGEEGWKEYQANRKREKATECYRRKRERQKGGEDDFLIFKERKIKNIKGLRSGLLVAVKPIEKKANRQCVFWECECDCGGKTIVRTSKIVRREIRSCGCQGRGRHNKYFVEMEDCLEVPVYYYKSMLKGAKSRNLDVEVDIKDINDLFFVQNKKCALSGLGIVFYDKFNKRKTTASLDRIDSDKGYVHGNIQWVHKDINKMKLDFKQEYFIKMCNQIGNFQKEL